MNTEELIVALSFVIFFAWLFKPIKKFILIFLDGKIREAIFDVEQAKKLREEAEKYFIIAESKLDEAHKVAIAIINKAEKRANLIISNVENEIRVITDKRSQVSLSRVAQHERQIIEELKAEAVELTINHVEEALRKDLTNANQITLIENTLKRARKLIN